MKKKIIIALVVCIILISLILTYFLLNNKKYDVIYLDINPSVKITLSKNKVKKVESLNDDAKEMIKL